MARDCVLILIMEENLALSMLIEAFTHNSRFL